MERNLPSLILAIHDQVCVHTASTAPSKLRGELLVGVTQGAEIAAEFILNPLLFHEVCQWFGKCWLFRSLSVLRVHDSSRISPSPAHQHLPVFPASASTLLTACLLLPIACGDHPVLLAALLLQGEERQQHHRDSSPGGVTG